MSGEKLLTLPSAPPAPNLKETSSLLANEGPQEACFMCGREQAPWDLIRPCRCDVVVHRQCLDTWRTVSPNADCFHTCDICLTQYEWEDELLDDATPQVCTPKRKFFLAVTRDITGLVVVCVGIAFLFGFLIVPALDVGLNRNKLLPASWSQAG